MSSFSLLLVLFDPFLFKISCQVFLLGLTIHLKFYLHQSTKQKGIYLFPTCTIRSGY